MPGKRLERIAAQRHAKMFGRQRRSRPGERQPAPEEMQARRVRGDDGDSIQRGAGQVELVDAEQQLGASEGVGQGDRWVHVFCARGRFTILFPGSSFRPPKRESDDASYLRLPCIKASSPIEVN